MKLSILCVDDESPNVDALERLFRKKYTVLKATSASEALKILDQNPDISLIISDQRMPQMTGVELLEHSIHSHPDTVRILLTGYTDIESVIAAINSGQIYRYLTKPWDPTDLSNAVDRGVERYLLTKELKEKNISLAKALDELTSLDRAKNHFMILINHELKTPLTSILSYSELMNESGLTDEQKLYLSRIHKSANQLKKMVDDVLLIISGQTGVLKKELKSAALSELFLSIPLEISAEAQKKSQQFLLNISDDRIKTDIRLLQIALWRILENAVRFGNANSDIIINSKQIDDGHIGIIVSNAGPPIPKDMITKVLEPFTLNEEVMNHSKGMGLGLSVCQSILKNLNADIRIENTEQGVQVSVILPKDK